VSDLERRLAALEARVAERDVTIAERDATIAERDATIAKLEKRIASLETKLGQNSSNSSMPPSTDRGRNPHRNAKKGTARKKRKKRPGGARRRELLPPEQVDALHDHFPAECGGCGERLPKTVDEEARRHQVTELPEVRPRVEEHRLHAVVCRCGCVTRGKLPEGVPRGAFGPRLVSTVALLTGLYRLSKRNTQRILNELFGVTISVGAVSNCERRVGDSLQVPHAELHRFVKNAAIVHADETSWQQKHRTHWLWVACTSSASLFLIQKNRRTSNAELLLGTSSNATLITDRLASYDFWKGPRQTCWAHIKRSFQALAEREGGAAAKFGVPLLEQTRAMFVLVRRVRDGTLQHRTLQRQMKPIRIEIERLLRKAAASICAHTNGKAKALLKHRDSLWTFVDDPDIDPTNNEAERALRHAVILRKLSFGTQSDRGSRFIERMLSAVDTLRKQERDVLPFLIDALQAKGIGATPPSLLPSE